MTEETYHDEPLFIADHYWLTTVQFAASFLLCIFLSVFCFWVATLDGRSLVWVVFGLVALVGGSLIPYRVIFYTDRFEFYDDRVVCLHRMFHRGASRVEMPYTQINKCEWCPLGQYEIMNGTLLEGTDSKGGKFVAGIRSNPKNKELGLRLHEWLQTKIVAPVTTTATA